MEFLRQPPAVDVLGVPVHNVSRAETVELLREMAKEGGVHHVVTVNPEFIMIAQNNCEFLTVLRGAALSLPDGTGIVWASRILGTPVRERVTGVDVVHAIAALASREGLSMFLLGAAPGVAERTAQVLQAENPGLRIAGTFAGSPSEGEEDDICARIAKAQPHFLLVAYGPPRQDLWIARTTRRLQVPVAMGVGGTFDFIAGVARRAPLWMQKAGLEWLHRLIRQPHRWRRMLTLPKFVLAVLFLRFSRRQPVR